jgi:HNH endonuclease
MSVSVATATMTRKAPARPEPPGAWPNPTRGSDMAKDTLARRFWSRVDRRGPDECWIWIGSQLPKGYGTLSCGPQGNFYAHRVSYELHIGVIPRGQFVLHRCDNPPCVNPRHLFLGSHRDNMRDMVAKERSQKGTRNPRNKLSPNDVIEIRALYRSGGVSMKALGERFGVSAPHIHDIVHLQRWGWLES